MHRLLLATNKTKHYNDKQICSTGAQQWRQASRQLYCTYNEIKASGYHAEHHSVATVKLNKKYYTNQT